MLAGVKDSPLDCPTVQVLAPGVDVNDDFSAKKGEIPYLAQVCPDRCATRLQHCAAEHEHSTRSLARNGA
jgi:hypothetical protein